MDALSSAICLSNMANSQPKSLAAWTAQYEALSVSNDWWFKAATRVAAWVIATINSNRNAVAPTGSLAHA